RGHCLEIGRLEPLVDRLRALAAAHLVGHSRHALPDGAAALEDGARAAGAVGVDARNAPVRENGLREAAALLRERQLDDEAADEAVPRVVAARPLPGRQVPR